MHARERNASLGGRRRDLNPRIGVLQDPAAAITTLAAFRRIPNKGLVDVHALADATPLTVFDEPGNGHNCCPTSAFSVADL